MNVSHDSSSDIFNTSFGSVSACQSLVGNTMYIFVTFRSSTSPSIPVFPVHEESNMPNFWDFFDRNRCAPNHDHDVAEKFIKSTKLFILIITSLVSSTALLYGLITWVVIAKSRTLKNYVFLNVIGAQSLWFWFSYIDSYSIDRLMEDLRQEMYEDRAKSPGLASATHTLSYNSSYQCVVSLLGPASYLWLFMASLLIYNDIVVVFNNNVTRRYLKSNLFVWGVSLLTFIIHYIANVKFDHLWYKGCQYLMLVVQVFFYMRVLYCLFKGSDVRIPSRLCRNVQLVTFTLFMSGIPILLASQTLQFGLPNNNDILFALHILHTILGILVIIDSVLFLILKSNRRLWCERRQSNIII